MSLLSNPFWVLGATTRDGRRRVVELAEERRLLNHDDDVEEAEAILLHPLRRLSAEMKWFPGLGPSRVASLIKLAESSPTECLGQGGLPSLAKANLLSFGFAHAIEVVSVSTVVQWVVVLAETFEELEAESIVVLINEDRAFACVPQVLDLGRVTSELAGLRLSYRVAIRQGLGRLEDNTLIQAVTQVAKITTEGSDQHVPVLVGDLIKDYSDRVIDILKKHEAHITFLVERIRALANAGENGGELDRLTANLLNTVRKWDFAAQPIQLLARKQGRDHKPGRELSRSIRALSMELYSKHQLLENAGKLVELQQEVFAEDDQIVKQAKQDASTLKAAARQRMRRSKERCIREMEEKADGWRRDITYEASVGMLGRKFRISPDGVEWKGSAVALGSIARVRWASIEEFPSMAFVGTVYEIVVGDGDFSCKIRLSSRGMFVEIVRRVWMAAGERLLTEMLEGLQAGKRYGFGTSIIDDYGIELQRKRIVAASESAYCRWADTVTGNGANTYYIAKAGRRNLSVELPYRYVDNVHVLEVALRGYRRQPTERISDLLKQAGQARELAALVGAEYLRGP